MFERLGLKIEQRGKKTRIIFTILDPKDIKREFYFSLRSTESEGFRVFDCVPTIEGFQPLVQKFNEDDDFCFFITQMRKLFKNTLK